MSYGLFISGYTAGMCLGCYFIKPQEHFTLKVATSATLFGCASLIFDSKITIITNVTVATLTFSQLI